VAAPVRTPREAWLEGGLRLLASGGPDAVRVEPLAKELGVTKGGFYHHFPDRQALLDALLDTWEERLVDEAIETVERGGGDARTRLRQLFTLAATGGRLFQVELAVRDWGRRDDRVAARVRRVDDRRMAFLRPLFAEFCEGPADVEGRSLLVLTLFVGSAFVDADQGRHTRDQAHAAAIRHLLR